jgi:SAM-dependent methyltransferase
MQSALEAQQAALARGGFDDFRASSLFGLVSRRLAKGSVLDVGCGAGGMVAFLLERGIEARGVDASAATIRAGRAALRARGLDPGALSRTPLERLLARGMRADNVLSMDCLEHVDDDAHMFAQLVEMVRPGGRLILTVPALASLYGERDRRLGHHRRYGRAQLLALARGHALRVDELRYWNLLGVAPLFVSARLLGRAPDERFRFGAPTLARRALRGALAGWFRGVENRIRPPLGLTLLLAATRMA